MDRRLQGALGGVVLVVLLVGAFLLGRNASDVDDDDKVVSGASTTTTNKVAGSTTLAGGGSPGTSATPGTPATTATTLPAGSTVVTTDGASLVKAIQPALFSSLGSELECADLATEDWTLEGCGAAEMAERTRIWLVESRPGNGPFKEWHAYVLRWSLSQQAWILELSLGDGDGVPLADITVRQADLTGDGHPELIFGFHQTGSGSILAYDIVVNGPGTLAEVAASRQLPHGRATVGTDSITDYAAAYPNNEPNCCPAYTSVSVVAYTGGAFRAFETGQIQPGDGPPPDPGADL